MRPTETDRGPRTEGDRARGTSAAVDLGEVPPTTSARSSATDSAEVLGTDRPTTSGEVLGADLGADLGGSRPPEVNVSSGRERYAPRVTLRGARNVYLPA